MPLAAAWAKLAVYTLALYTPRYARFGRYIRYLLGYLATCNLKACFGVPCGGWQDA